MRTTALRRNDRIQLATIDAATRVGTHLYVPLLADLADFVQDHRPHGPLAGDATEPASNGYLLTGRVCVAFVFERWVSPEDAEADLLRFTRMN